MSWSWRIVFSFVAFMAFILTMVFIALKENVNLVAEDYYEQEIQFQDQMDRIRNSNALATTVDLDLDRSTMVATFLFPGNNAVEGQYHFFRPSDNNLDQKVKIDLDSNMKQSLSVANLQRGLWKVKITWKDGSTEYFEERILII